MALSIAHESSETGHVPRVWFFPKTRMRWALSKLGYEVGVVSISKKDSVGNFGEFWRDSGQYYLRFRNNRSNYSVEVEKAVAPYVVFAERRE